MRKTRAGWVEGGDPKLYRVEDAPDEGVDFPEDGESFQGLHSGASHETDLVFEVEDQHYGGDSDKDYGEKNEAEGMPFSLTQPCQLQVRFFLGKLAGISKRENL
jgi:hypothetical protein